MILLNKSLDTQDIFLTLTELTTIVNPVYLLVLSNDFTKTVTRFVLQNNLSDDLNRYDHYQLATALISSLEQGLYTYRVYQSVTATNDETLLGNAIECGKAKVIDPGAIVQPIIYESVPTEFVTYNSND